MLLGEKMKEFEGVEAELRRQVDDLQKKHNEARAEIDEYQRRYIIHRSSSQCLDAPLVA